VQRPFVLGVGVVAGVVLGSTSTRAIIDKRVEQPDDRVGRKGVEPYDGLARMVRQDDVVRRRPQRAVGEALERVADDDEEVGEADGSVDPVPVLAL